MLYRKPLMRNEKLKTYYESYYVETYKLKESKSKDETHCMELLQKRRKYNRYLEFLTKNGVDFKGKRILDVGCGAGWFLAMSKERDPLYCLGIEPSKQCCKEIESKKEFGFKVLNGCLMDFSADNLGSFDVITLIGVLEYLSDPISDLKTCKNFMSDNSYICIYAQ